MKHHIRTVQESLDVTSQNVAHYKKIAFFLSHRPFIRPTRVYATRRYANDDPTLGIISLGAGIAALACGLVMMLSWAPVFAVVMCVLAIAAIVCGAMGINRRPNGTAIAGMSLGIAVLVTGLVYVALLAAFIAAF